MAYYTDEDLLIVKLPMAEHEAAHGNFATEASMTIVGQWVVTKI